MFSLDIPIYLPDNKVSASDIKQLDFITEIGKNICSTLKKNVEISLLRAKCIVEISDTTLDIDLSIKIEAGIYEYSVVYCHNNNFDKTIIGAIYNDKLKNIIFDLIKRPQIIEEHLPQQLAFKSPSEIDPDEWSEFIRKRELKEYKKKNIATTDLYKCYKCNERRCQVRELQTRSADEPMTLIITCLVCGNQFTK